MTVDITMRDQLAPIRVQGTFTELVNTLNIAAASGKQYVILTEHDGNNIALDSRAITIARDTDNTFMGA